MQYISPELAIMRYDSAAVLCQSGSREDAGNLIDVEQSEWI